MKTTYTKEQALTNAVSSESTANYQAIFEGFAEMGIPVDQIKPRENVFTFKAWKALGRFVKKGEHGVKVVTWIQAEKKNENGESEQYSYPRTTTVFHISQTDALQ